MPTSPWPDDLRPEGAPVFTRNELVIEAPPQAVWEVLIRAVDWPEFYDNAKDVRIEGGGSVLGEGAVFTWRTFGIAVRTEVIAWEPGRCLAWRGDDWKGRGCHTWLLEPEGDGTRLVTEEVQRGPVPWLGQLYLQPGLLRWHQLWLEGIAARATRMARPNPEEAG